MSATTETIEQVENLAGEGYKHGFVTDIEMDTAPKGLSEDVVRFISAKKGEPEWMLEWRLKAYRLLARPMEMPSWQKLDLPEIDYQDFLLLRCAEIAGRRPDRAWTRSTRNCCATYEKLGIPLREQELLAGVTNVAVDAVFDSVSVATTFKKKLNEAGVIFCPISEAIQEASRTGAEVSGHRRALYRQLLSRR